MKTLQVPWILILLLAGQVSAPAQMIAIAPDGADVILSWEADGVLQFAADATGPWFEEVGASSPYRVTVDGDYEFFRVYYPNGFQPEFEPPEPAFAEPNSLPSLMAQELTHTAQAKGWRTPEINDEVLCYSGETRRIEVDLRIPGRGLDFIWARTYRSRHGPNSAQGNRWSFSYDVHIQQVGPHVRVFDGSGRSDWYLHQPDGTYAARQLFREGHFESNGVFAVTFADTGVWEFRPLNSPTAAGRIARIADRNGNELMFQYDPLGRLTNVIDALNRNIQVVYNADGFIEYVTDFTGRQVHYEYYRDFEVGGSFGDLKLARSPVVTGAPTLNDFPGGKTNRYSYSEGFADERENHLLLSVTDPKGQMAHEYVYQHNSSDLEFLRCRAKRLGYSSNWIQFHYVAQTPAPSNQFAVQKAIINDRMGNVSEQYYDAGNRLVLRREYTGRADPSQPTTDSLNRPMNPLRPTDPPYFETAVEYNEDSLPTWIRFPSGNSVSNVYESALSSAAPRYRRGNLRERRFLPGPLGGAQSEIVQQFEYDSRFGSGRSANSGWASWHKTFVIRGNNGQEDGWNLSFPVRVTDARSNSTFLAYDARGNCTNIVHRIPTIIDDFEYNSHGQRTAHILPDNGSGFRRRDQSSYYTSGPQMGYLQQYVADFDPNGFNQTTTYTYDAVGNILSMTDPRGHDALFTYNALDQLVHAESRSTSIAGGAPFRQKTDYYYDANDNLVRVCESNADESGRLDPDNAYITTLVEYDILDHPVHVCAESGSYNVPTNPPQLDCSGLPQSEFITTEYAYNRNGDLTLVRFGEASEGRQPANTVRTLYDERDLPFRIIRAEGDASQSTAQCDYDPNGNLGITYTGLEAMPQVTEFFYDGYNRCTNVVDAMGNMHYTLFNPNGVPIRARTVGETNDVAGSLGNIRLTEVTNLLDAMDRLTRRDVAFFDTATGLPIDDGQSTTVFTYSDSSQLLTRTDDNKHVSLYAYDRLHRLFRARDARSNEVFYAYDANSNPTNTSSVEKSDLGNPDQTFNTRYVYDARDRLVRAFDNVSNSVQYAYDSRNNLVLTTDPVGVQTRRRFDGTYRLFSVTHDMNGNGADPAESVDITVRQTWDDSDRIVQQVDDNSNVTTYVYDPLNRMLREVLADGTGTTNSYDVRDNRLTRRDANRNAVDYAYDLLNRVTNKTVVPGPGVSSDTTFERFRYDGLSRLMRAEDNDSVVELTYNSLGSVLEHQLNGQTTSATYDSLGNTLRCRYPGGRVVGYAYDPLDRIKSGLDASNNVISTYYFVGPDRMERMDYANQTRIDCFYDGLTGVPNPVGDFGVKQRIRTLHTLPAMGQVIDDRVYWWDRRYSKTTRLDQRTTGPALRHDYLYDDADRLRRAQVTAPPAMTVRDTEYVLDGVGNRLVVTNNSSPEYYTMDPTTPVPADLQVNQYTTGALGLRTYDDNGNLNALNPGARDERLFQFDYADRLVLVADPGNALTNEYSYDPLGRRIAVVVHTSGQPPQVTRYFYGADWSSHANVLQVVEEQDDLGATLATYMYGGGLDDVMNMQRGGNDYHFHHDDLGSVMAVTDKSGAVVERYEYGDFGEPVFFNAAGTPRADSAIGNPYLFTGRRYDADTGLYYFRSRYLDPNAGRFVTRDPLGTWGDPGNAGNGLTYVGNNPWTHTDPLGLAKEVFVRSKPHVNVGTIGHVDQSGTAGQWPGQGHIDLWSGSTTHASPSSSDRRKQSLYFPESMLAEIQHEAYGKDHRPPYCVFIWGNHSPATTQANRRYLYFAKVADVEGHAHGHLDFLKVVGDPATSAGDTGTHEVGHWMGLYHTFSPSTSDDGVVDGRDFLIWRRGSSPASSRGSHPDFAWVPTSVPAQMDGAILVVSAADGPMPQTMWRNAGALFGGLNPASAAMCFQFPIPCPTCPNGYYMRTICTGGGGGLASYQIHPSNN